MACFTVGVALVHREPDVIIEVEFAITSERQPTFPGRRGEERVPTFRTEEMLLVICPLPQCFVIKRNKPLVNNSRFTVITAWRKVLVRVRIRQNKKRSWGEQTS